MRPAGFARFEFAQAIRLKELLWSYLGSIEYETALRLQLAIREEIGAGRSAETLLLVEHPPVITRGRSADCGNILVPQATLQRYGIACVSTGRGGDVTYHGPGQLVGYPLRRVGRQIKRHVQGISDALIAWLAQRGVRSWWREDAPGLWTDRGKIAAIGVDARGRITMHGFALNLDPDMEHFALIRPCGYDEAVTSLCQHGVIETDLALVASEVAEALAVAYGCDARRVDAEAIWSLAGGR